jgi:hypothetical protein
MNKDSDDLNIFYYGGSGGFLFLHLLLLSGNYTCHFHHENISLNSYQSWFLFFKKVVYKNQWNIGPEWKNTESWPINSVTQTMDLGKQKIYFTCNQIEQWESLPGKKVFLYTDLRTELRLAWYKKAFAYYKKWYKDEIVTTTEAIRRTKLAIRNAEVIDGEIYTKGVQRAMEQADVKISLKDLVNNPGAALLNNFDLSINESQQTHIDNWINLHPVQLLSKTNLNRRTI